MTTALFLTPAETGSVLGCSQQTVRRMVREGELKAERRGRNLKIPRSEVERLAGTNLGPTDEDKERKQLWCRLLELQAEESAIIAKLARVGV